MTRQPMLQSSNRRPGMPCPQCGFFMEISIPSLLNVDVHKCAGCGLELILDRNRSRESMGVLSQVQCAVENLEAAKRGRY